MTVSIHVPGVLRSCCGGASELAVSATTVRGALDQIEQEFPALYASVCNETGAVRPHVNLFINSALLEDKRRLERELAAGDVVTIFQAVSGG